MVCLINQTLANRMSCLGFEYDLPHLLLRHDVGGGDDGDGGDDGGVCRHCVQWRSLCFKMAASDKQKQLG
eukprot:m.15912 g.15912  ORF g.15912 m.15912 type:complete len:70 (+) comp7916_c0_seq1:1321-1530(+)